MIDPLKNTNLTSGVRYGLGESCVSREYLKDLDTKSQLGNKEVKMGVEPKASSSEMNEDNLSNPYYKNNKKKNKKKGTKEDETRVSINQHIPVHRLIWII